MTKFVVMLSMLLSSLAQAQGGLAVIDKPPEGFYPCPLVGDVCQVKSYTYVVYGAGDRWTQSTMFSQNFACQRIVWTEKWKTTPMVQGAPFDAPLNSKCYIKPANSPAYSVAPNGTSPTRPVQLLDKDGRLIGIAPEGVKIGTACRCEELALISNGLRYCSFVGEVLEYEGRRKVAVCT